MSLDTVKLVSLNVNGLRQQKKRKAFINNFLYPPLAPSPQIVCLQETHFSSDLDNLLRQQFQYEMFFLHGPDANGGLAIAFSRNLAFKIHDKKEISVPIRGANNNACCQCLLIHCDIQDREMIIANTYVHPDTTFAVKDKFLGEVGEAVLLMDCQHTICCGDFNMVMDPKKDTTPGAAKSAPLSPHLRDFIDTMEWVDSFRILNPTSRRVTHFRAHANSGKRLDHIFVSGNIVNELQSAEIHTKNLSDHCAVSVGLSLSRNPKGRGYWRFPDPLLKNKDFIAHMKSCIKGTIERNIHDAEPGLLLDTVKCNIRGDTCNFLKQDGLEDKVKNECFEAKLAQLHGLRDSASPAQRIALNSKIVHTQLQWTEFLDKVSEKRKQFQSGRAIRERDRSTKYFFRKFNPIPGSIKMLYNERDIPQTTDQGILDVCEDFYSRLYNQTPSPAPTRFNFIPDGPENDLLDDIDNDLLSADITLEELHTSLMGMKVGKACGLDGISVAFLQTFWEDLGPLILNSFYYAFRKGFLTTSQRRGVIKLIPKRDKNPNFVRHHRPITLLNIDLKVLTRALALRVKTVLDKIINNDQQAFVKNRYLGNNLLDLYSVASEAITQDDDFLLFSLDIEKAFDSVRWDFLYKTLSGFGFPPNFIHWIQVLHNKKELRIYNNGHSSGPISVTNSLAQGCPLSPLLFIACIETLARIIRSNPAVPGISLNGHEKKIGLVADDTVLIVKASEDSLAMTGRILLDFENQSGLRINYDKSIVCSLGPNQKNYSMYLPRRFLWLQPEESFSYLGLKLQRNTHNEFIEGGNWRFTEYHLMESVNKLRYSNHSLLGRILLIKSMLASKFVYKFSLLPPPPAETLKSLNSFYYKFLWKGGVHKIDQHTMEMSIDNGGFNMLNVYLQDKSLKFIWLQRILTQPPTCFWQIQVLNCFTVPLAHLLQFNITHHKLSYFLKPSCNIPPFWSLLLKMWFSLRYIPSTNSTKTNEILQRGVCFNSVYRYKHSRMMEWYHHLLSIDVFTIRDFLRAKQNRHLDVAVQWLVLHLPTPWLLMDPEIQMTPCLFKGVTQLKWTVKQIYCFMRDAVYTPPKAIARWSTELQTDITDRWTYFCKKIQILQDVQLRAFHLKLIHRGLLTNSQASHFMVNVQESCSFCGQGRETLPHILWSCSLVQPLLCRIYDFLIEYTAEDGLEWNQINFLFSNFTEPLMVVLTTLLKKYIFSVKWQTNTKRTQDLSNPGLSFHAFLMRLRFYIRGQRLAHSYADTMLHFRNFWMVLGEEQFIQEWDHF